MCTLYVQYVFWIQKLAQMQMYMYIVVAMPKQDSMSPARALQLDIYVIDDNQLVGTTHSYSCLKPFKQCLI